MGALDQMVARFQAVSAGWEPALQGYALDLFGLLAVIQFVWAMIRIALQRGDFADVLAVLVNQIIYLGLFYWLLTTTTTWGPDIINSFRQAAAHASGGTQMLTPSAVFAAGVNIAGTIMAQVSIMHPGATVGFIICGLVVLACFAWIAATMILVLAQSFFVANAGVILMGFGGSAWTQDLAISVIRTTLAVGVRLFALQLVASVGTAFVQQWSQQFNAVTAQSIMIEIGQALVLAVLTKTIPDMFGQMVGGANFAHGGALFGAGAAAVGVAAGAAGAAGYIAAGAVGTGALAGSAARLAGTQMAGRDAAGSAPSSRIGRAASLVGMTAGNVASAAATDIGRRLSGQGAFHGMSVWRQNADLTERNRLMTEDQAAPPPPPPPTSTPP